MHGLFEWTYGRINRGLLRVLWRVFLILISLGGGPVGAVQQVLLSWEASTDASVTGYRVYRGTGVNPVYDTIDVGAALTCHVPDLREGESYQFYVTAYDALGLESDPSNTLSFIVPLPPLSSTVTRDAQGRPAMRMKVTAVAGRRVALESSTDLASWVRLNTSAVGSAIDMTVLVSSSQPQRFFRSVLLP